MPPSSRATCSWPRASGNRRVFTGLGDDYVIVNAFDRVIPFVAGSTMIWLISQPVGRTRSNSMAQFFNPFQPLATAGDFYNQIPGFDVADDVIVHEPHFCRRNVLVNRHPGQSLIRQPFVDPLLFFYTTGTGVDATTDAFNFIKIEHSGQHGGWLLTRRIRV